MACQGGPVRPDAEHRAQAQRIAAELAAIARTGQLLPGSMASRLTRCGHPNCRCRDDPPQRHGPYWQWTRKVAAKTVGRWLSQEQADDYQPWVENARRARELLAELEALGAATVDADPRTRKTR